MRSALQADRPAAPAVRLPTALVLAALAGLALWAAFPPVAVGWSAVVGSALLALACWRAPLRRGALVGLIAGGFFFGPLLEWMQVIGDDAWFGLALLCAAWLALVGGAVSLVTRLPGAPVWVAAVWVLGEALRSRIPLGGFPWGTVGFAQPDTALGGWAWLGGMPVASFAVVLVGAVLANVVVLVRRRPMPVRPLVVWSVVAVGVVVLPTLVVPLGRADPVGTATIAVVQGGTPQMGMGAMDVRRAVLDNHVRQTLDLAAAIEAGSVPRPAFVLWPENSSDIDLFADADAAAAVSAAAKAVGVPILVGVVTAVPGRSDAVWNAGVVWDPVAGPTQMYVKTHPVPFGEYVPFRGILTRFIDRLDRVPRDMLAGDRPGNLTIGGVDVGNVICFEIAYGDVVDAVVDGGAQVITVQTNNATYGGTSQPAQQLQISRMRAIETGRSVLVAATSGISAVIAADGSVSERLDEGAEGWLVPTVATYDTRTPGTVLGAALELAGCALAVGAITVAAVGARRARRHTGSTAAPQVAPTGIT